MRAYGFRALALALSLSGAAQAAGKSLVVEPMDGVKVRIDGDLREWPAKMTELGHTLQGSAAGDPKARAVVGYDDKNLYVVVTVTDNKLARDDHATLHLAFPKGRDYVTYDVGLYPGIPGKAAGAVKVKGAAAPGAKLVEAPSDKGYEIEAQIPWSVFPESGRTRVGLRASVSLSDADGGAVKAVIGTSSETSGRRLPPLMLATEAGLDAALLRPQGLGTTPTREIFGNVAGDGMVEKVAQYGNYLTITGPRFRGGKEFYFGELGTHSADMVRKLDLHDFDGDGLEEIVIQKRIGSSTEYREVLQVMKVGKDDTPFPAFTHEVGIKSADGLLENKVKIAGDRIEISQGEVEGFEPDTYDEPLAGGMESALLPWDSIGSRSYKWQGNGFGKADEKNWQPKLKEAGGAASAGKKKGPSSNEPPPPPPPRPPTADELLDRVYALYRKDRGVGGKPRFDFVTDVAGDRDTERVLIHDRDIVVFGKGFRAGQSYAFITVGVAEGKDILDATARDLTGDGKAEIILRGVLHAKASKALGGDTVDRHALFVYGVQGDQVVRIFAAETGRSVGKDRILGAVAFEPDKKGLSIELRPAQAVGWTQKTYPFPPDTTTAGGLEPLLLPWGDSAKRRYRWSGSAYVLE